MSVVQTIDAQDRFYKVSSILVSQPKPSDEKSPYFELANKYGIKVDFRAFIQIDPVPLKELESRR
jgi:uroporphyrinogen-III synthase